MSFSSWSVITSWDDVRLDTDYLQLILTQSFVHGELFSSMTQYDFGILFYFNFFLGILKYIQD